jgi:hypothetical protein
MFALRGGRKHRLMVSRWGAMLRSPTRFDDRNTTSKDNQPTGLR